MQEKRLLGLGIVAATHAVNEEMKENLQFRMDVYTALERYRNGDWELQVKNQRK